MKCVTHYTKVTCEVCGDEILFYGHHDGNYLREMLRAKDWKVGTYVRCWDCFSNSRFPEKLHIDVQVQDLHDVVQKEDVIE